jgi:hypothetical protein
MIGPPPDGERLVFSRVNINASSRLATKLLVAPVAMTQG